MSNLGPNVARTHLEKNMVDEITRADFVLNQSACSFTSVRLANHTMLSRIIWHTVIWRKSEAVEMNTKIPSPQNCQRASGVLINHKRALHFL